MHLRRYHTADFALLQQWVTSPALLFQFAGTDFAYPLTKEQLDIYQALYPERRLYIASTIESQPVAFGEIIPQDNNIPRLARLLVGNSAQRGKGLGEVFVDLLIKECQQLYHCSSIDLFVLDENAQARRCYEKKNFFVVPNDSFRLIADGQAHLIHRMRLDIAAGRVNE